MLNDFKYLLSGVILSDEECTLSAEIVNLIVADLSEGRPGRPHNRRVRAGGALGQGWRRRCVRGAAGFG